MILKGLKFQCSFNTYLTPSPKRLVHTLWNQGRRDAWEWVNHGTVYNIMVQWWKVRCKTATLITYSLFCRSTVKELASSWIHVSYSCIVTKLLCGDVLFALFFFFVKLVVARIITFLLRINHSINRRDIFFFHREMFAMCYLAYIN